MNTIKEYFKKIANFFRLLDENNQLSITNVAVLIVLVKIAMASDVSLTDAGALLISLVNYTGKKVFNHSKEKDLAKALAENKKLDGMQNDELNRIKDDVVNMKDRISALSIKAGFSATGNPFGKK